MPTSYSDPIGAAAVYGGISGTKNKRAVNVAKGDDFARCRAHLKRRSANAPKPF